MAETLDAQIPVPDYISPQAILRAILATDFRSFIEYSFGVLRPGIKFRPNWHIDAMAYKLSQVATGEIKRLIITIPPRNLKSISAGEAPPHHRVSKAVGDHLESETRFPTFFPRF